MLAVSCRFERIVSFIPRASGNASRRLLSVVAPWHMADQSR